MVQWHTFFDLKLPQQEQPGVTAQNATNSSNGGTGRKHAYSKPVLVWRVFKLGNDAGRRRECRAVEVHGDANQQRTVKEFTIEANCFFLFVNGDSTVMTLRRHAKHAPPALPARRRPANVPYPFEAVTALVMIPV